MNSENGTERFESLILISLERLNSSELETIPNLILSLAEKAPKKTVNQLDWRTSSKVWVYEV
jgi:hypothetical protein